MSWDIYLRNGDDLATVERHEDGGTYVVGGTTEAHLNVTWNYGEVIYRMGLFDGAGLKEFLHGKQAADVIPALEDAVKRLGTFRYRDYWAPTPGNTGYALNILLIWARQHPTAVFEVEA